MQNSSVFEERRRKVNPKQNANILSKIFFWWTIPIFMKGVKRDLNEDDLFAPLSSHESALLGDKLEKAWFFEERTHAKPSLHRPILRVFGLPMLLTGGVIMFTELVLRLSIPLLIGKLMEYYSPDMEGRLTKAEAYYYSGGICLVIFVSVLITHSYMLAVVGLGMQMRVACCSLVYRKTLRLSQAALADNTIGQMVNLLSNDVSRLDAAMIHLHSIWLAPVQTLIVLALLYQRLGLTAVTGMTVLAAFVPLQMWMGKKSSTYRLRTALKTDERVRLMNEIISGMQVIKMYTWERSFAKLVELARKVEIQQIRATSYLRGITISFKMFVNRIAIYLCILTYVLTRHQPRASYVFVVIAFYNILRQSMTMAFPQGIATLAETLVSIRRITQFLLYEEVANVRLCRSKASKIKSLGSIKSSLAPQINNKDVKVGISIENASAVWTSLSSDAALNNITLNLQPGELVAIVGPVGAGKSSLLQFILGELKTTGGSVEVHGSISYASQCAWLFAGTVQQNILFGDKMDHKKYQEVIRVCALERDLSLLPHGDRTIVGERGVTLSGGQKARINLARAVYRDSDIYLLDDPLSAVDTHVGKQLFDDCIAGYLRSKCVVLVTHQLQYLRNVDRIYVLESGEITANGSYQELSTSGKSYAKLLQKESTSEEDVVSSEAEEHTEIPQESDNASCAEVKEQRSVGTVSGSVYRRYFRAGGNICSFVMIAILLVSTQFMASFCDYFITFWVNLEEEKREMDMSSNSTQHPRAAENADWTPRILSDNLTIPYDSTHSESMMALTALNNTPSNFSEDVAKMRLEDVLTTEICIYVYSTILLCVIVIALSRSVYCYRFCMRASSTLHNTMFYRIVYAPMKFYNTNPSGRILNRFSKDMGSIDEVLPTVILDTVQIGLNVLAITTVVGIISPWILVPSVVILSIFYGFRVLYLKTSRSIKRMEGTTRSPVFSHINASLQGLTTIRAFGAQDDVRREFDSHQDLHSSAFYMFLGCTRTFGMWLDLMCVIYIALVTLGFLFIGKERYGGNVGLSITQAISLTGMFQWGMRQWSELENQMTSVERVLEYTDVEPENDRNDKHPPAEWPELGEITFKQVYLRYAENEDYVLKNLNFTVRPREKVGIVGRTGAGKSSLITALFRLTEFEGSISIDKIDTKALRLQDVRSKISIIPQEPVLFSGTLRKNLDPFEEFGDKMLWDALDKVQLKSLIYDLPAGLETNVTEGGANFSVGQRQLICLARAIIRDNRILVLDEATANVDPRTDGLIQATIRNEFAGYTVLTIAHRLNTVMDSDKVLVMDAGCAVEFDHPYRLLQDESSVLSDLVKQTGKSMADYLLDIAQRNHETRTME